MLFEGFDTHDVPTPRGAIHARIAGGGPPLLLLHGYPESHLMWHSTAPKLAERFTVIVADLPGYGDSFKPAPTDDHSAHSKRALGADLLAAMRELGHERFALAGHDRGGRVGYRLALDHPEVVTRLAVLDIVPTGQVWRHADALLALGYWHWGFLAQPAPLPEQLLAAAPEAFWLSVQRMGIKTDGDPRYPAEVLEAYRAQAGDAKAIEAICEDYRAGATVDRALDDADCQAQRTISCPMLVLWAAHGALPVFYEDPLALWRGLAPQAIGRGVPGTSHFLVEDDPGAVVAELLAFLA